MHELATCPYCWTRHDTTRYPVSERAGEVEFACDSACCDLLEDRGWTFLKEEVNTDAE